MLLSSECKTADLREQGYHMKFPVKFGEAYGGNATQYYERFTWFRSGRQWWQSRWENQDQPPYFPDLAPSDFFLFLKLKPLLNRVFWQRYGHKKEFFQDVWKSVWIGEDGTSKGKRTNNLEMEYWKLKLLNLSQKLKLIQLLFPWKCQNYYELFYF